MNNEFSLVWEDNPDTPITAHNLSKTFSSYTDEDRILYWDYNDSKLKIKANSKVNVVTPLTNAFFTFENTVISHNGKFVPEIKSNITYRKTSSIENSMSIAMETITTNLLTNTSFENGLTGWGKPADAGTTISIDAANSYYGEKCALIKTSSSQMSFWQDRNFSDKIDIGSFSFYYKSEKSFNLSIVDNPDGYANYWRKYASEADGKYGKWETSEDYATITVPASSEWARCEVKSIDMSKTTTIRFKIVAPADSEIRLDAFQFENKPYCTSYTDSSRTVSALSYSDTILDLNEGAIDIVLTEKWLNSSGVNTIFACTSSTGDAMRLNIENTSSSNSLVFLVYDNTSKENISTSLSLNELDNFIDVPMRIICNWDKTKGIYLYQKYLGSSTVNSSHFLQAYEPKSSYDKFDVGSKITSGVPADVLEGLIDKIKINNNFMTNTEITNSMSNDISVDANSYNIYENHNYDVVVDESLLDSGSTLQADKNYYLWVAKENNVDACKLYLSLNNVYPDSQSVNVCRIFGGFRTDPMGNIDERTIWDIESSYSNLLVNRFVTFNPTSGVVTTEIRNDGNDSSIIYNAPITSNNPNTFNDINTFSASSQVVINSVAYVDNIKLDENTITTKAGNLNITATGNVNVVGSASGKIYLDYISFDENVICSTNGNLLLTTPTGSTTRIVLSSASGANPVESQSNIYISSNKKLYFDNTSHRQFIDLYDSSYGIGTASTITYLKSPNHFYFYQGNTVLAAITDGATMAAGSYSTTSRLYAGRVHNAIYNDLAECWLRDITYDVDYNQAVVQTKRGVRPSVCRAEKGTVGVVSDSYGFLLNDSGLKENLKESLKVPICISGRVKVNAHHGVLDIGDEVVSYKNGTVVKANWFEKVFMRDRILGRYDSHVKGNTYWIKV